MTRRHRNNQSLQDRIRARQQKEFIGRQTQVARFRDNLALDLDDDRRQFIFNIWGQGGVGKTTLLNRCMKIIGEHGGITALTNEAQTSIPDVLAHLSALLKAAGHELKNFDKKYAQYKEKREALETDADAPLGIYGYGARVLTRTGFALAKSTPVGAIFTELMDEDAFTNQVSQLAEFTRKKFHGKTDDVRLVLEPEEILTPLFFDDLDEICVQKPVLLCFDTYEQTGKFLDSWLRDLLEGRYGSISQELLIAIAGRNRLDDNLWQTYESVIGRLPLEPFSEEEAINFLQSQGVEDEGVVKLILELSGRMPLLLATLAKEAPQELDAVGDPTETAIERFLKWVDDPAKRQLAMAAALPRSLNEDIVALLSNKENASALFAWLREMPFVSEDVHGWKYHLVVREQLFRGLRKLAPERFTSLHESLANYYDHRRQEITDDFVAGLDNEQWRQFSLEHLYHRLCQQPQVYQAIALNESLNVFREKWHQLENWGALMTATGNDLADTSMVNLGQTLLNSHSFYANDEFEQFIYAISNLERRTDIENKFMAALKARKGFALSEMKRYEDALAAFDQAIEIDPQYDWAMAQKGCTLHEIKQYEDALAAFDQAIHLKADDEFALASRGQTHWQMGNYEAALADLDQAIQLKADYEFALALRSATHRQMGNYKAALADLDQAIQLKGDDAWALLTLRSETHRQMGNYKAALADLDQAIQLKADYEFALASRGQTHRQMGNYVAAMADLDQAIQLKADDEFALANRGATHWQMGNYEAALTDLDQAIQLKADYEFALVLRGETHQQMGNYEAALADLDRAIHLKADYQSALVLRGATHQQRGNYEAALADLDQAIHLKADNEGAFALRGQTHGQMGNYEAALADFDQAIQLKPDDEWALAIRGQTHRQMGNYEAALADLDQAISLNADSSWRFYTRALTYLAIGKIAIAQQDLTQAINKAQEKYTQDSTDWQNSLNLAIYHLAAANDEEATNLYQAAIAQNIPLHYIRDALQDLAEYRQLFPDHSLAQEMQQRLQDHLQSRSP